MVGELPHETEGLPSVGRRALLFFPAREWAGFSIFAPRQFVGIRVASPLAFEPRLELSMGPMGELPWVFRYLDQPPGLVQKLI